MAERQARDRVQRQCVGQDVALQVVLILFGDIAQRGGQSRPLRRAVGDGRAGGVTRALRRGQAVKCRTGRTHAAMAIGVGGRQAQIAERGGGGQFHPLGDDSLHIAALARGGGERHIGNGVVQPIVEGRCRQSDAGRRRQVDADFRAFQLFGRQRIVGLGRDGEHHEGAVEFVERGQAETAIGRAAQGNGVAGAIECADPARHFPVRTIGKGAGGGRAGGGADLPIETVADRPAIGPDAAGQNKIAQRPVILSKNAGGRLLAAGMAAEGHGIGGDIGVIGVLKHVAAGKACVDAEAQQMIRTDRRAQLNLAAKAGRGRVTLVQRLAESGGGHDHIGEIACLNIGQCIHLPPPAINVADAGILSLAHAVGPGETQRPVILKQGGAKLQFGRGGNGGDRAQAGGPAFIGGRHGGRDPLRLWRGLEPVALVPPTRQRHIAAAKVGRDAGRQFGGFAAAVKGAGGKAGQLVAGGAGQFDRPCHCARAERTDAAAARHPHDRQAIRDQRAEGDITEKGIGQRHPVQQQQRAAGRIAAQRAQRRALRRGVGRSAVGTAKLLEARNIAQHAFDPARRTVLQPLTIDHHRTIDRCAGGKRQAGASDDDRWSIARRFCHGSGGCGQ